MKQHIPGRGGKLGYELPQGFDTPSYGDTTRGAVSRGCQAKHDSTTPPVPGIDPLHLSSPSRQVGLGSCTPCHRASDPRCQPWSHTLRARVGQRPGRGQLINVAPKGQGNSAQQRSGRMLPRKPAQLEFRPPLQGPVRSWVSRNRGMPQTWTTTQASRSRPHWMGSAHGGRFSGAFPSDVMGGQGHCSGINSLLLSKGRAWWWPRTVAMTTSLMVCQALYLALNPCKCHYYPHFKVEGKQAQKC